MRKSYFLAAVPFLFGSLIAQPVIDGSEFTGPGTDLVYLNSAPGAELPFDLGDAGENLTWDFSDLPTLDQVEEVYEDINDMGLLYQLTFSNPEAPDVMSTHSLPLGNPAEDLDLDLDIPVEISDAYRFFRNDATGYYEVGLAFSLSGFPLITSYDDTDRIYPFPLSYDDRDTVSTAFDIEVPLFGYYGQSGMRYTHADAWGTLITPYGTYDVVRVKSERLLTDTIFIGELGVGQTVERPMQTDYAWISPDAEGEVLRISVIDGQTVNVQMLTDEDIDLSTEAADLSGRAVEVWPNPATDFIRVRTDAPRGRWFISDVSGKTVLSGNVRNAEQRIAVGALAPGVYIFAVVTESGVFSQTKFVRTEQR